MSHKLIATFTVHSDSIEGTIDLKEIECGPHYLTVEVGSDYCPKCGETL